MGMSPENTASPDTIVATATAPGRGGIGVVRLSGARAYAIALAISHLKNLQPRQAVLCSFYDENQAILDEGLLLYFNNPHSFTGEDVVEFQCHGSPIVMDRLIQCCLLYGARLALAGEFSQRAFLNDKIDLTQAEAIADLINACSDTAARMAIRSLKGDFSKTIHQINDKIIGLRLYVEAAIDFSEEEVDFLAEGKIAEKLAAIISALNALQRAATQGALLQEGLSVVIAGPPNAGKSTLINYLAQREVAIVTEIAGTTRDVMRERIMMDDLPLYLVDTAGLRDSQDIVEREGIKRAWQEVSEADCILLVMDSTCSNPASENIQTIEKALPAHIPVVRIMNKIDSNVSACRIENDCIYLSAKSGEGIPLLKEKIKQTVGYHPAEGLFLARRRHLQALEEAMQCLRRGQHQLQLTRTGELLAEDLRLAHQSLAEITGEFTSDDLLGVIFSHFCIGK